MTFLMMTGLAHAGSKEPLPVVTIRVENEARVDERILQSARKEAIAMLSRAGVTLIWADCGAGRDWEDREACKHSRGRNEFWMQITADRPRWSPRETLGFADLAKGDGSGGVYYPAVVALVRDLRAEAHQILAAAMVHEIGHLILGADAHTPAGVMCGDWSREQYKLISAGRLDFAPHQAKRLPMELKRRLSGGQQ
jgi:hypothetical protein